MFKIKKISRKNNFGVYLDKDFKIVADNSIYNIYKYSIPQDRYSIVLKENHFKYYDNYYTTDQIEIYLRDGIWVLLDNASTKN